jgi:hypothetical protein
MQVEHLSSTPAKLDLVDDVVAIGAIERHTWIVSVIPHPQCRYALLAVVERGYVVCRMKEKLSSSIE